MALPSSATSALRVLWALTIGLASYGATVWLSQAPSATPGYWFALAASGPSLLFFLAHGGSLELWAFGICLVIAPLLVAAARGTPGLKPYVLTAVCWFGLCVVFGLQFLLGALA